LFVFVCVVGLNRIDLLKREFSIEKQPISSKKEELMLDFDDFPGHSEEEEEEEEFDEDDPIEEEDEEMNEEEN